MEVGLKEFRDIHTNFRASMKEKLLQFCESHEDIIAYFKNKGWLDQSFILGLVTGLCPEETRQGLQFLKYLSEASLGENHHRYVSGFLGVDFDLMLELQERKKQRKEGEKNDTSNSV